MPNYKFHLIFGFITVGLLLYFLRDKIVLSPQLGFVLFVITMIGSLLPDIDSSGSKIFITIFGAFVTIGTLGVIIRNHVLIVLAIIFLFLIYMFSLANHRGLTHTIWFAGIISFIAYELYYNSWLVGVVCFVSIYSHQLLDGYPFKLSLKSSESLW